MRSIDGEGSDRPNAPSCKAVQLVAVGMAKGDGHGQCIGGIIGLGHSRQMQQVAQFKKLEGRKIPADLDYTTVNSLRREAVQKLNLYKPENIGQASRISGVSPADISVLMVHLEQMGRK